MEETLYFSKKLNELRIFIKRLDSAQSVISYKKDRSAFFENVLEKCMKLTNSDCGIIYLKQKIYKYECLKLQIIKSNSKKFNLNEFILPIDKSSIAGIVAVTGKILNLEALNKTFNDLEIRYKEILEKHVQYKFYNMLVVPFKNENDEIIGVMELANKKKNYSINLYYKNFLKKYIVKYTLEEEMLITFLASQMSIVMGKKEIYEGKSDLITGLIETIVTTIKRKDPITCEHSIKVANYAVKLAKVINKIDYGKYKDFSFNEDEIKELYYASLLHDIGKIGIKENILTKKNKLSQENMELINYRFAYIKNSLIIKKINNKINDEEIEILNNIDAYYKFIQELNQKKSITKYEICIVEYIHNKKFYTPEGTVASLLTNSEMENITILNGNLTKKERKFMNLHPLYTYQILSTIPWIKKFSKIPQITLQHHEKLDGSGYPNGLKEEEILVESRILTILDIYEALIAKNRPYKKAVSKEDALDIIKKEVDLGKLDGDIFDIFVKEEIYKCCQK